MSDIFISYARSTATQAQAVAEALRGLGYGIWLDDELPAHRAYAEVIEERLKAAKAVVVIWSAEAAKSEWVQSEADRARADHKLVQLTIDGAKLPMPFDRIQCADLAGWAGDLNSPGWRKVAASVADLVGAKPAPITHVDPVLELPSKPSIAVMPFTNLSGDPDQDYFADGMVVEITNALSRFKSIFVIASSSTLTFRTKAVAAQDAARQLGVRYILEGSVRKARDRVRIAVQLIDSVDGAQTWAERFEDTLDDVFALQDRVALSVAGVIEPAVTRAEMQRVSRRPTKDMGSYDLTLRAAPLMLTFSKSGVLSALELLDRAMALDREHGMALATAAFCHAMIFANGWGDDLQGHRRQAGDLGRAALQHTGEDSLPLTLAAEALTIAGESLATGIDLAERARALNPGAATAWFTGGWMRVLSGQPELGAEYLETSMRLDPLSFLRPFQLAYLGVARFEQRRFAEAIAFLEHSAQLSASYPIGPSVLPACYGHLGQIDAALRMLERRRALTAQTLDQFADWAFRDPTHRKLYMDGIALAEGKTPASPSASAAS